MVTNPELIGLTENEELRERGLERNYCDGLRFDRYINGYQLRSVFQIEFASHWNFSISVHLDPITPEMYSAAQQKALTEEEVASIVYEDLNVTVPGKNDKAGKAAQNLPKLKMHKYLLSKEPYAFWEVRGRYLYEINAVTGEIAFKQLNIKY